MAPVSSATESRRYGWGQGGGLIPMKEWAPGLEPPGWNDGFWQLAGAETDIAWLPGQEPPGWNELPVKPMMEFLPGHEPPGWNDWNPLLPKPMNGAETNIAWLPGHEPPGWGQGMGPQIMSQPLAGGGAASTMPMPAPDLAEKQEAFRRYLYGSQVAFDMVEAGYDPEQAGAVGRIIRNPAILEFALSPNNVMRAWGVIDSSTMILIKAMGIQLPERELGVYTDSSRAYPKGYHGFISGAWDGGGIDPRSRGGGGSNLLLQTLGEILFGVVEDVVGAVTALVGAISTVVAPIFHWVHDTYVSVATAVQNGIDAVGRRFTDSWDTIKGTIKAVWDNPLTALALFFLAPEAALLKLPMFLGKLMNWVGKIKAHRPIFNFIGKFAGKIATRFGRRNWIAGIRSVVTDLDKAHNFPRIVENYIQGYGRTWWGFHQNNRGVWRWRQEVRVPGAYMGGDGEFQWSSDIADWVLVHNFHEWY